MAEQEVELRRVRDFGENLSDTFAFLRQHANTLLRPFLAISAVFMAVLGIFSSVYESHAGRILKNIFMGRSQNIDRLMSVFDINYFMVIIMTMATIASMQVIIAVYMKYYTETHTKPGIQEVWTLFKRYFLRVCLFEFLAYFTIVLGCVFCLFPGIYLGVVLAPLSLVIVVEDKGLVESYQRCLELIKDQFWPSFGLYIVAYLFYAFGAGVIGGGFTIIGWLAGYLTTSDLGLYVLAISAFLKSFSLFFYIIYFVCVSLNYFSLVERREGTGIMGRINNLGNYGSSSSSEEQF
ncbi:MAG: hypothetical protein INR73_05160 [Williamsia sp.]|nr:hypothetical protein [Williamsia sp.]